MAVIKTTNPKVSTLKQGIKYITNPEKTELITGKDCTAETALEEMKTTKELYNKTEGRQYMHFVQSFKPDDPLDPAKAHQIGLEMAEKRFKGYEVLVATHTDKDHLHNHFIVNSVSFETGAKFQHSKDDLKAVKELSDQICEREGLHVIREKIPGRDLGRNEYQVAIKGESWKFKTMTDIDKAIERTQSKEEFIKAMEVQGYQIKWTDTRKHITYITPEGHKVRDNKLHDQKYLKEAMANGFRESKEIKFQPGGTRSTDELSLNWTRIENGEIAGRTDRHEQPGDRGQSRPDQEIGGGREGANFPNQATQRTRHDHQQKIGRATTTELSKAGEGFPDHQRGSDKEPQSQYRIDSRGHGSSAPGQEYSQPELEGTSEAIRNTTADNSRTSDGNSRSVQTSDSLNDAIKALGSSFEKVQQEEKLKAQLMKEKLEMIASQKEQKSELMKEKLEMKASQKEQKSELMKEKLEMKASQKTRSKGKDWGPEL